MRVMGLEAAYPKPHLSQPGEGHTIYPYQLQEVKIERVNQVWIPTSLTFAWCKGSFTWWPELVETLLDSFLPRGFRIRISLISAGTTY